MEKRDIGTWRRAERERLIAARLTASPEQHRRWSSALEQRLLPLLLDARGGAIGLYWPYKGEFNPLGFAPSLIAAGRHLALPAITDRHAPLEYRAWHPESAMEEGRYGISVPTPRVVLQPEILLVPLVGFDRENFRLGYGGGYFDRTLAALTPRPITFGVAFELSRLPTIYPQLHDVALDIVVTEETVQEVRNL